MAREQRIARVYANAAMNIWRLALSAVLLMALSRSALAQKDIKWEEFHSPESGKQPAMGPPVAGAPGFRNGCKPAGDGAWYRFCQCPGSGPTSVCTITYFSLAPYSCQEPPSPIYLVSAIGRSKEACGKKAFERTKAAWAVLEIKWEPHDFQLDPDEAKEEKAVGQLDNPGDKKPDEKTPLKKEEKKEEKKAGSDTDKKDTDKKEKRDNPR